MHGEDCCCTIGEDHINGDDSALSKDLSESDAEDIWLSSGLDEDYDFRWTQVQTSGSPSANEPTAAPRHWS